MNKPKKLLLRNRLNCLTLLENILCAVDNFIVQKHVFGMTCASGSDHSTKYCVVLAQVK